MTTLRISGEPPTTILLISSSSLIVAAMTAIILKRYYDLFIISFQCVGAMLFHSFHTPILFYIDQVAIYLLAVHCFLIALTSLYTPPIFCLYFGYMTIVYVYGQYNKCFCFDPEETIADRYHASIHILGTIVYTSSMILFLPQDAIGIFVFIRRITL